jgi:phage shock protein PspC (stress-responsive transcriptional regulator)
MGIFSKLVKTTVAGSIASVGVFWGATRNDIFEVMDSSDPIFQSAFYKKFNPSGNPTLHDVCVRRIPLDKIQPSLVEEKGKLVEAFCAGVWGGMGKYYTGETSLVAMAQILIFYFPSLQAIFPSEPSLNESTVAPRLPTTSGTDRTSSKTNTK